MWIIAAIFSAVFAGLTVIFTKYGIHKTNSDVAAALRTIIVLMFLYRNFANPLLYLIYGAS